MENVQRYFTRCITGLKDLGYQERLQRLDLPSLEYRRLRGDLIEVYKIKHGAYDTNTTNDLFKMSIVFKLIKPSVKSSTYRHFFTNRIINTWNKLPKEVAGASSVNAFKNRIDKFFAKIMYTIDVYNY